MALADHDDLPSLRHLNLRATSVGEDGVELLTQAEVFANLDALFLQQCTLGPRELSELFKSPHMHPERLYLSYNNLSDEGAHALAETPQLRQLRRLDVRHNAISEQGLLTLIRSPYVTNLTFLGLRGNAITPKVKRAISEADHLHPVLRARVDWKR